MAAVSAGATVGDGSEKAGATDRGLGFIRSCRMLVKIRSRYLLIALALALAIFARFPFSSAASGLTSGSLDDYWRLLSDLRAAVRSLRGSPLEDMRTAFSEWAERLEALDEVALPDGTTVRLDHGFLLGLLRAGDPDPAQIEELLTTLLRSAAPWQTTAPPGGYQEALEGVLARPEFQWEQESPSPLREGLDRVVRSILSWLSRWLAGLGPPVLSGAPRFLLAGGALLLLLLVLVSAGRAIQRSFAPESVLSDATAEGDKRLTSALAAERARALSEKGEYRAAMRYLYLSSLLFLEEEGIILYDRALTNREVIHRLSGIPGLGAALRPVVDVFEHVWYGRHPLDESGYLDFAVQTEAIRREL